MDTNETTIDENSWEEIRLQQSMMLRSVFKRHSFFPTISVTKNEITIIASFIASGTHVKDMNRFTQVTEQLTEMDDDHFFNEREYKFGISLVHHSHSHIKEGYKEAKRVAELKQKFAFESNFYEDLGIYRLLLLLNEQGYLDNYVEDYLQDLIDYDKKNDSNLFETLRIYLECGGSKKETADRLFIVRQTLYHRLEKIESIMGENFMSPLNRIALEVAIMAKQVLK